MAFGSKLLIKHGFVNTIPGSKYNDLFDASKPAPDGKEKTPEWFDKLFKSLEKELGDDKADAMIEEHAQHDWAETVREGMEPTFYPIPMQRHHIIFESPRYGVEPIYFWCLNHMDHDVGYTDIIKITDVFAAAEHSSFFGAGAQRKSIAQDRVTQFLATTGKMIKEMFQMVRELRWIDERLAIYKEALEKKSISAERTLKGLYVDLVDGVVQGQRTGSNLWTMAQQLQFTTLPSLFFNLHPKDTSEIDDVVDKQASGMNKQVQGVVRAKLQQYMQWRNATYEEMKHRRKFMINYLAQHFSIIRMYMQWAKPYLKRIQALSEEEYHMKGPNVIKSFETSFIEIEILGKKSVPVGKVTENKKFAVMIMSLEFQTSPSMSFSKEGGYHRGPSHMGTAKMWWRCYAWTQDEIDRYVKMKREEDLELMKVIDKQLMDAMEALGDSLRGYLEAAGQKWPEATKGLDLPRPEQEGILEPFRQVGKAFAEPAKALIDGIKNSWYVFFPKKEEAAEEPAAGSVEFLTRMFMYIHYKNFKKSHKMLAF